MQDGTVKRIALFGASGFIGCNLALRLIQSQQYELTLLDIVEDKLKLRLADYDYKFIECDISRDKDLIDDVVESHDLVVDLAAFVHPSKFVQEPLEVVQLNLFDTLNVVNACAKHNRWLMHFSTSEVYGKTGGSDKPFREDETDCILGPIVNQRWIYSNAKQLLDRIIHAHAAQNSLKYSLVRPFNFVGPLMDHIMTEGDTSNPRVFAHFMSSLMFERPLQLVNGGHSRRCFTHIEDAISGLLAIIENPAVFKNQIINIGNPENESSIRDLAHLMTRIYDSKFGKSRSPIVDVPGEEFYGQGYEDCDRRVPDITKLSRVGWTPKFSLEQTFENAMTYCWENKEALMSNAAQV